MSTNGSAGNAPVKRVTSGRVSVAIFENEGANGKWYSMVPQRSYREDGEGEWKQTNSYNRDDGPVLASLLMQAHAWVVRKEESNRHAERAAETAPA